MPSRRPHTKSRHGCNACKARKVKCDEGRPFCAICIKRGACCVYSSTHIATNPPDPSPGSAESGHRGQPLLVMGLSLLDPQTPSSSGLWNKHPVSGDWCLPVDFELLHHYTTSTYLTLSDGESYNRVWQVKVPQEAFSNAFLMQGILAIAALHLGRLRPATASHYNDTAMQHWTSSVSLFRPILDQVSKENALSVFIFSSLAVCISFALPAPSALRDQDPAVVSEAFLQNLVEVFSLERGIDSVLQLTWHWLINSPLASQLRMELHKSDVLLTFDDELALNALETRIRSDLGSSSMKTVCLDGLRCLREIYACSSAAVEHKAAILAWPVMVSPAFFEEISKRTPHATVILAYYGALLHELRNVWWVANTGVRIIQACATLLGGDWSALIAWAEKRVGLK